MRKNACEVRDMIKNAIKYDEGGFFPSHGVIPECCRAKEEDNKLINRAFGSVYFSAFLVYCVCANPSCIKPFGKSNRTPFQSAAEVTEGCYRIRQTFVKSRNFHFLSTSNVT